MHLSKYQCHAFETARYPDRGNNIVYPALGLTGEAGEVADKIKKLLRDDNYNIGKEFWIEGGKKMAVAKELGDVLWYVAILSKEMGYNLEEIAEMNLEKLRKRIETDKIKGSGDDREDES